MPENHDGFESLINREKFWSPAFINTYKNRRHIWETIRDTNDKVIISTESAKGNIEDDKSGANDSYRIPCKYIFEGMELQYAPVDGDLKNKNGETIVTNRNPRGVLIKKKEFMDFLEEKEMDIIWTILGEKFSYTDERNEESFFKVPCGVFYFEKGKIVGELKMHDRD